jgi:hypothetical protein
MDKEIPGSLTLGAPPASCSLPTALCSLLTAMCSAGELFDLFERGLRRALFPSGELREAVRKRVGTIARALASPT